MSGSLSFSKFFKSFTEARDHTAEQLRLCVVGTGPELARVVGALSTGAEDAQGGVSSALDALSLADFPRDAGLAGRWEMVVLVAAGWLAAAVFRRPAAGVVLVLMLAKK